MQKKTLILLILAILLCLTGCSIGIKNENTKAEIIESVSNGLKTNDYNELSEILKKYNNSMFDLIGDEDFINKLYSCIKKEYESKDNKENFYDNINSLLIFLENHNYKDSNFRSKMYSIFLDENSNIINKLDLYQKLEKSKQIDFYKRELINKRDIDNYIESSTKESILESGKGGYYDDSNNKNIKSQGQHYEGWHTKSSSVGYSGDFAYEYISDEYVDDTFYEIHHNNHYEIYYKGTKLSTTINKIPEKAYYASPYLFIELDNKTYILKVDNEVYASIIYTYPENNR